MTDAPGPGLRGDYHDSCVACLRGTDTALGFRGEAEWIAAALAVVGIPLEQAGEVVGAATGSAPGLVPVGEISMAIRLCRECAAHASVELPAPGLVTPDRRFVPWIAQPR